MKIYSTKFLFTHGIVECDADISYGTAITNKTKDCGYTMYLHGEGKEWHRTKESAIKRAEEMRIRKIKSLNKKINEITKMVF